MKLIQDNYEDGYHESFFMREQPDSQRIRQRLALLMAYHQEGMLLEVGVGHGGLLKRAAVYFNVEGLDISQRAVARLAAEFGDRVRQADITSEPLPPNRYDVIAIFNVLEHLRHPEPVLDKCHYALKAGGVMIGSMPAYPLKDRYANMRSHSASGSASISGVAQLRFISYRRSPALREEKKRTPL